MQYRKALIGVGALLVIWPMSAASQENVSSQATTPAVETKVSYDLVVGESSTTSKLRVANHAKELRFVHRPAADRPLVIEKVGQYAQARFRGVEFQENWRSQARRPIPLKAGCAIEMPLGALEISDPTQPVRAALRKGVYRATMRESENVPSEPAEVVVKQEYVVGKPTTMTEDSFPLSITLKPTSASYRMSQPMIVNIGMSNNSALPIVIQNFFDYPYGQNFSFHKRFQGKSLSERLRPLSLIGHHATKDWLTLLPGETLWYTVDIGAEFSSPGDYAVAVSFIRGPVTVYFTKPRRSVQQRWRSPETNVTVVGIPEPAQ